MTMFSLLLHSSRLDTVFLWLYIREISFILLCVKDDKAYEKEEKHVKIFMKFSQSKHSYSVSIHKNKYIQKECERQGFWRDWNEKNSIKWVVCECRDVCFKIWQLFLSYELILWVLCRSMGRMLRYSDLNGPRHREYSQNLTITEKITCCIPYNVWIPINIRRHSGSTTLKNQCQRRLHEIFTDERNFTLNGIPFLYENPYET